MPFITLEVDEKLEAEIWKVVKAVDTDRSKFIRGAVREKLLRVAAEMPGLGRSMPVGGAGSVEAE